jgi:hypothetical protein
MTMLKAWLPERNPEKITAEGPFRQGSFLTGGLANIDNDRTLLIKFLQWGGKSQQKGFSAYASRLRDY